MNYIYLHGFLSGPDSQKGLYLQKRFRELDVDLHVPDLNAGNFERMTISSQMEVISETIEGLTGDVTLLGSSLGGYLAALTAMKQARVKKLVLMAPAFDFMTRYIQRLPRSTLVKWKETGFIELYHYHHREKRRLGYGMVEDARRYRDLKIGNSQPALLIHGLRDESVPYRVSIEYLSAHPSAELLLLPSDHGLLDILDIIWDYTLTFLKHGRKI